ncbi:MAG: HDIG domain-containing protein [Anaerolineae bacterium]|jgi:putative nucleotidyltransferase with HDIG domain|nr:HDIG domain-containing protein [Anaerolineae bacterium]
MNPTREDAWKLVNEHTANQNLVRHMLAVEAAMRAYARRYGEDEELWGIVGLVHDFDYEGNPDLTVEGHPVVGARLLQEWGWPAEIVRAVLAHAGEYTGVQPETTMEKALVAVDELTGFLVAVALVRPSGDIRDITKIQSVKKKWKDRAFAAAVNREEIEHACQALGVDLWTEHVPLVLNAMQEQAAALGLDGSAANQAPGEA